MKLIEPKIILRTAVTATLCVAPFLLAPKHALAQNFSLSLEPTISSITLPYESSEKKVPLTLRNASNETTRLRIEIFPIQQIDKITGRPIYQPISDLTNEQQSFYSSAISFEQDGKKITEIILSPKQSSEISLKISNKGSQNISEYYFSVGFIKSSPPKNNVAQAEEITASSDIQPGIATHILVSTGTAVSDVELKSLSARTDTAKAFPSFDLTLKNSQNKHSRIYGNISIYNLLNQKITDYPIHSYILGDQEKTISLTKYKATNKPPLSLGINSARLTVTDEASGKTLTKDIYYLTSSKKTIAVWVLVLIFLIYIFYKAAKRASRL